MAKQLAFDEEAFAHIREGVTKLARAVKSTLGPRGRNAVLDKSWGAPTVTKDGVTVAEEVELQAPLKKWPLNWGRRAARRIWTWAAAGPTPPQVLPERFIARGWRTLMRGPNRFGIR